MSTIAAGTTSTTGLVQTSDTTGNLVLQVNGTTPTLTLNTAGAHGVGSSPSYGTAGQFLTSQGSAASPTWTSVSIPSSAMTLISTQNMAGVSTINWTGLGSYSYYKIIVNNVLGVNGDVFNIQFGYGATPTYLTSGYYQNRLYGSNTATGADGGSSYTSIMAGYIAAIACQSEMLITSNANGVFANIKHITPNAYIFEVAGAYPSNIAFSAIKINGGNTWTSGTASLYGISS